MTAPITLKNKRPSYKDYGSVTAQFGHRWVRLQQGADIVLLTPDQVEALIAAYRKKYR